MINFNPFKKAEQVPPQETEGEAVDRRINEMNVPKEETPKSENVVDLPVESQTSEQSTEESSADNVVDLKPQPEQPEKVLSPEDQKEVDRLKEAIEENRRNIERIENSKNDVNRDQGMDQKDLETRRFNVAKYKEELKKKFDVIIKSKVKI